MTTTAPTWLRHADTVREPQATPDAPASTATVVREAAVPAVTIRGISFTYPTATKPALDGVDLEVEPGQVVALLGPNGAGKSTLVSLLLDLNRASTGSIEVFGQSPRAALRNGEIGAMLQSAGIADYVSIRELVTFVGRQYPNPLPAEEAIDLAGLTDKADRRVEKLSGGEQQRVRFALALVGQPRLLILDEPTNEMDVASRFTFWRTVREAANRLGRTVFFTTHHMDEVATAADRVVVIAGGTVIADETPLAMRARAGKPQVQFRWAEEPPAGWLERLSGDVSHDTIDGTQIIHTLDADRTLRELVTLVPEAVDLTIREASLDDAYLSVIGSEV